MCQLSQHKFQNDDEEWSIENHVYWTPISTFSIIILRKNHYLLKNLVYLLPIILSTLYCIVGLVISSTMSSKFKGIYKSFKYFTHMFAVKERELEIGYPTDVKHVAHIGWDGPSGNGPSWMNEFKTAPDFSTSLGNLGELSVPSSMAPTPSWSSQDFEESTGSQSTPNAYKGISTAGAVPRVPKKSKKKNIKPTSSSEPLSTSSRHSRSAKSKAKYREREAAAIAQVKQIQDLADREKDLAM